MEDKLCFESNLTEEKLQKNFEGIDFFTEVMAGLEEALNFCKGNACSSIAVLKKSEGMTGKETNLC